MIFNCCSVKNQKFQKFTTLLIKLTSFSRLIKEIMIENLDLIKWI
jgi:histone H3/H4